MNSDRINEILNFLSGPKCIQNILLGVFVIGICILFWIGPVESLLSALPFNVKNIGTEIINCKNGFESIKKNKESIESLKKQIQEKEAEKNRNKVVIKDVDVKIYKPKYQGLSIEASAIDFVTNLITTLEKTDNEILDLSYNSNIESSPS